MLTFTDKPSMALILTYKDTILELFPKIFNLIQNDSLKKFMVHGVLCICKANRSLPIAEELFYEF
jgi:hypothetical protein